MGTGDFKHFWIPFVHFYKVGKDIFLKPSNFYERGTLNLELIVKFVEKKKFLYTLFFIRITRLKSGKNKNKLGLSCAELRAVQMGMKLGLNKINFIKMISSKLISSKLISTKLISSKWIDLIKFEVIKIEVI